MAQLKLWKNLRQYNKMPESSWDPQYQRARGSALFPLTTVHQADQCSWRIQKANVFDTHTTCKNKSYKS